MTVAGKYVKRDPNSFVRNRRSSIARGVGYMAQRSNDDLKASIWVRPAVVFALIVQQGAFINKPPEMFGTSSMELADVNMLNTIGVAISVAMIVIPACFNARKIGYLASKNALTLLYMALVLISVVWSINPDLTIRRGLGYVLSMAIAAFLTVRFDETERMKLLSASLAVSAIGSLLYVAAMNEGIDLTGSWSGVFPGKNVLGLMMALGLFVELFVLVASRGRPRWRFILLSLYFALVLLSRSATAVLISAMYLTAAFIYLLWKRDQTVAVVTALIVVLASLLGTFVLWVEPEFALGLLGKDTGLTGRTALWDVVVGLIQNRPWLGYGYRVMWSHSNPDWFLTSELVGGWDVKNSQNAFLEVGLDLGAVGISVILAIIVTALWRSIRCCLIGIMQLGWFSSVFFVSAILAGQTEPTLGSNQNMFWLIFTIMFFSCGTVLAVGQQNKRRQRKLTLGLGLLKQQG